MGLSKSQIKDRLSTGVSIRLLPCSVRVNGLSEYLNYYDGLNQRLRYWIATKSQKYKNEKKPILILQKFSGLVQVFTCVDIYQRERSMQTIEPGESTDQRSW